MSGSSFARGCRWLPVLLLAVGTCAYAQTRTIAFEDALAIALERNILLRRAQLDAAADEADVRRTHLQFLPDLRLDAVGLDTSGRTSAATQSLTFGVSSQLNLFNGFRDVANRSRAQALAAAGKLELGRIEETIVFEVAEKFLALLLWQEQARVQRDYLAGEIELETQVGYYVEAGARAAADLYQQQANVAAARVFVIDAQAEAERAMIEVMRTLQLPPEGTYDFLPRAQRAAAEPPDLAALLARAHANRADVHALEARLEAAQQGVRAARASYWPTLTLETGYTSEYADASTGRFDEQVDRQRAGVVALNLAVPLFDRGAARHQSRRATLDALRTGVALEAAREDVGLQVREAYLGLQAARERLTAADAQQRAAARAADTAQERFRGGAYSLVELSKARSDLVAARGALARAQVLLSLQQVALEFVVGDIRPASDGRN